MTHVRQTLRAAVVTACTGLAATGSRVYASRVYPLQEAELPCLLVTTPAESSDPQDIGLPGIVSREVTVEVAGIARATSALADTLDAIAEQVETALGAGVSVAGQSIELSYGGMVADLAADIDQPTGRIALRFAATLYTQSNAPGTLVSA